MDEFDAGVTLAGNLFQQRFDYELSYRPGWWRKHERLALSDEDQARDRVRAAWANRDTARGWSRSNLYSLSLGWSPRSDHRLSLRLHGSPAQVSGTLRPLGRRLHPGDDFGIATQPARNGAPLVDPVDGAQGTRRLFDHAAELQYRGALPHRLELEAAAAWRQSRSVEMPAAGSDSLMFIDNRRRQLHDFQAVNGIAPAATPAQYRFGGLGWHEGGAESRTLAFHLQLSQRFNAAGFHQLKYGLQYVDRRVREDYLLNSGPRGEAGPIAALYTEFFNWDKGKARLRNGAYGEVYCAILDPAARDFAGGCPEPRYALIRGSLAPRLPLAARRDWSAFLQDDWGFGRLRLTLGLRYLKSRFTYYGDYTLLGVLTGRPLIGPDGYPVGTRDPDNPFETAGGEPDRPIPAAPGAPKYAAGPGRFVGGGYRFPAALSPRLGVRWYLAAAGRSQLYFNAARLYDELPDELVYRAFNSEFGVQRAIFQNPDFTVQLPGTITYGGLLRKVQPNTRLGYADHYHAGWRWETDRLRIEIEGRHRRQGRILAETQANAMEGIANFFYERAIRLRQCQNCTGYPMFPDYPAGNTAAARGFLSPTLANPGDNTPPGRFGMPSRYDQSLTLRVRREAGAGRHFSWNAEGRIARARGNYEGVMVRANGSGEERNASLFDYPLSHLTRSQYADGPLDPDQPTSLQLEGSWQDFGIRDLRAELGWRWWQGSLRTPLLRSPFSIYTGLIPGTDPQYYRFAQALPGYTDLLVLKDYAPAARGALGRNPAATSWELALHYRRPFRGGALALRLEIRNLLNQTRVLAYDDALEPEPGYPDPATSGSSGESLRPGPASSDRGIVNPVYGLPATVQLPRMVRLGAEWSF